MPDPEYEKQKGWPQTWHCKISIQHQNTSGLPESEKNQHKPNQPWNY